MNDERFMKHYVKVVNATLTESILRNVNLQANANFVDDLVGELNAENESLKLQIQEMGEQLKQIITEKDVNSEQAVKNKQEIEHVRHQLNHLETFRNQLIETQKLVEQKDREIEDLKNKIQDLQTPPPVTKRKKTGSLNTPVDVETPVDTTIKDGGTF
jgi:uncharacterized coiled-coil DUF342 family protein